MRSDLLDSVWRDGLEELAPADDGNGRARVLRRVKGRRRSRVTGLAAATFTFVMLGGLAFAAVQDVKTGVDLQPPTSAPDDDSGIIHATPTSRPDDDVSRPDGVVVPPGASASASGEVSAAPAPGASQPRGGAGTDPGRAPDVTPTPGPTPRSATPANPGTPAPTPAPPDTTPATTTPGAPGPTGPQPGVVETSPGRVTFTVVLRDGPNGLVVLPARAQMPAGELTVDFRDERVNPSFIPTLRSTGGPVQQGAQRVTYVTGTTAAFRTLRNWDFKVFNGAGPVVNGPTLTVVEPVLRRDANVEPERDGLTATIHTAGTHVWLTVSGREVRQGEPILANRHTPGETMLRNWTNVAPGSVTISFANPQQAWVKCSLSHVRDSEFWIQGDQVVQRAFALPDDERTIEVRCEPLVAGGSGDDFVLWVSPQAP